MADQTTKAELEEQVDRLLHDAEHALSGAAMAKMMRDDLNALLFRAKAQELIRDAKILDPNRECAAWTEGDLVEPEFA